jgi:hypothetical protein
MRSKTKLQDNKLLVEMTESSFQDLWKSRASSQHNGIPGEVRQRSVKEHRRATRGEERVYLLVIPYLSLSYNHPNRISVRRTIFNLLLLTPK